MNKKDKLEETTILALQGKLTENVTKLKESKKSKVLIYPSSEYSDDDEDLFVDITNEKGILFGYFNDEDIDCYSTGYNNIQDLEKAIKNKEYMLPSFEDEEDFDEYTGEECWEYVVDTIEESGVDGDSGVSYFLIDTNNNYEILYCGIDSPDIYDE